MNTNIASQHQDEYVRQVFGTLGAGQMNVLEFRREKTPAEKIESMLFDVFGIAITKGKPCSVAHADADRPDQS